MSKKIPSIDPPTVKDDPQHAQRLKKILSDASGESGDKRALSGQSAKFIEAARSLGCDENESVFDNTLKKLSSAPPPKDNEKRKSKKASK